MSESERWRRAYEDAYHALRYLDHCCGEVISEYEPPDDTQLVLGLNGKVHSVDGWDVPQPMHDEY